MIVEAFSQIGSSSHLAAFANVTILPPNSDKRQGVLGIKKIKVFHHTFHGMISISTLPEMKFSSKKYVEDIHDCFQYSDKNSCTVVIIR